MRVNVFIISWWHNTASKLLAQQLFSISFLRQTQSVWRNENISKVNENIMIIIINIINSIHSKSFQQQHTHNISIYTFIYLRNIPIRSSLYCLLLNMWTQYNDSDTQIRTESPQLEGAWETCFQHFNPRQLCFFSCLTWRTSRQTKSSNFQQIFNPLLSNLQTWTTKRRT